jgi:tetratricopeptide (TPR) repeat protein/TolB-like protein
VAGAPVEIMSLNSGQKFGSYEIVKLLGQGGMGEVYLARDLRLNRHVAIKILSSNVLPSSRLMERFRREAGLSAVLNHPNICTIYDTGEVEGQTYICMEYVEGVTLRERLRMSPMNVQEVLDTAIQIADALDEARKKNIVHRDIKSGNILLTPRSQVKILDFGLAKQVRENDVGDWSQELTDAHLTQTGEVRGTAAYMSPEQALGKTVDHRSDIFSFGIVLYEMITGRLPFSGSSTTEVVDAILHKEPAPATRFNNEVSDELIRVLNKMLQKDPELRYQSVHEVWVDLRTIQAFGKTSEGFAKRQRWWERKNFPFWPAAIIAGVLLMLVGFAWIKSFRDESRPIKAPPATIAQPRLVEVAVLPFRYAGDDPDRSYLGAMVTDALIAGLQVVPGLIVAPYENVREINADSAVKNITNHLGVQSLVKGVVTLKGEATEITTEIISSDGSLLAKQTLTGRPVSTIELIKKNILSALHVADIGAKQIDQIRTPSVEAYKKYLEARNHHEGWDVEGNLQKAAKLYEEALLTDPDFAAARALLAITLVSEFHRRHDASLLSKANVEAKRAMALDPDLPEALLALGMIQLESGNSIEARDAFTRALEVAPGNDAACRSLGAMYASLGRKEEARDMLKRAVELRPSYSTNHYELGTFELQYAGDFKAARRHLEKAHELHPDGYAPLVVLGGIDLLQGNLESAETYFRKAIERSPNAYSYNNLGLVYYYRGQYELALRNWEAVLKEAPEKPLYRANVADALRQLGEREQAGKHYKKVIEDFRASLKLNRSDDKSRAGLAMALAAIGECKEASELTRGVLSRHPDSPELAAYAAIAVSRCDDVDWAKQIVLNSIAADNLLMIRYDPDLNRLRQFPEVKEALAKLIPSAS